MTPPNQRTSSLVSRLGGAPRRTLARLRPGTASERTNRPRASSAPRRRASRGVSEVIGFILIFGVIIVGMTLVQLYGVPATNERLEFEHSQRALGDVAQFSDMFTQVAATGQPGSVTVEAGMTYPSRLFLFNPPPVSGALRTANAGNVTIWNAHAEGDAGDHWNGEPHGFPTAAIEYRTGYNLYDGAPTRYVEHGLVYDRFDSGSYLARTDAPFIEGRTITFVTLTGDLDAAGAGSVVLDAAPVSVPAEPLTLSNPGGSISITIPSGLTVDEMLEVLDDELEANGGYVRAVSDAGSGLLRIVLVPDERYDVTLAALRVGSDTATSADEAYLVAETPSPVTVGESGNASIAVSVRDRLHNPVSGVHVAAETLFANSSVATGTVVTDADGIARFEYISPTDVDDVAAVTDRLDLTMADPPLFETGFKAWTVENASVAVRVLNTDRSGLTTQDTTVPQAGYGGITIWDPANTTHTFVLPNGQWVQIDEIGSITLSDGEEVTLQYCPGSSGNPHADCRFVDELRLTATIWSGGSTYGLDVQLLDTNRDGDYVDTYKGSDSEWSELRHVTITDANTDTVVFQRALRPSAISAIQSAAGVDILTEAGNYESGGTGDQAALELLKLVDANWFTGTVHGRLDVDISPP